MKALAKYLLHLIAIVVVLPLLMVDRCFLLVGAANGSFVGCSQLLSLVPGKTGSYLRIAFFRFAMKKCHRDCFIGFGTLFSQRDTVICKGVYIGPQCNIGACRIGQHTLIASGVHIMSGTGQHRFDDLETPIRDQGGHFETVTIGEDCWLGNASLIMAHVGDKTVVGAGSVVNKPLDVYVIAAGNPARVLKTRLAETPSGQPSASA
ncbi:transferase hexapeptide repeat containing protein [gamma proteobacterium NOR5-3]|nr:transferase hexapeptide repeat containing protein [gamma proteobacterium NOR5-3]